MTSLSLVPEIAKFNNITFKNLIKKFWKMLQLINKKKIYLYFFVFNIINSHKSKIYLKLKKNFLVQKISIEVNDDQVDKKIFKKN